MSEAVAERMPVVTGTGSESFAALYERTFPRVYAYVASLVRDRPTAEDVTAQAFERAYRKRSSYRARRGSMEAWLFGIARNAALDELRRKRRNIGLESDPADTSAASLDDHAELALRREVVRAAMAGLDGHERDLLALKFSAGLSNGEIGKVLGVSETNAGSRLHRTLTKLRKACDDAATGNEELHPDAYDDLGPRESQVRMLGDAHITPLFEATIEATEEAIVNAMLAAETMRGRDDVVVHELPADALLAALADRRR